MGRLKPVPALPLRAIGMIRVSKVGDRGDDLISPELQREAITSYAVKRGATVVEWVEALDESASKSRSPWWARLDRAVASIEAGDADAIFVWKLSRAARHRRRWAVALDRVEVAGGVLESATEGFDSTTSTGRLSRGLLAELAAWEADVRSEQWKETHARRYRLGLPHTKLRQFGYLWDDEQAGYRPDPETGPIVVQLYRDYAAGKGFLQLIRWLDDNGVRTFGGAPWSLSAVTRYLDGGFAAGLLITGRRTGSPTFLKGAHPPLIDGDLWAAYLARREQMRKVPARRKYPKHHLAGLLVCSRCGQSMVTYPLRNKHGTYERYFRCVTMATSTSRCQGVYVSAAVADQAVRAFLAGFAADATARAAAVRATRQTVRRRRSDVAALSRELDALKVRGQRMLDRLDSGLITDDDYRTWRADRDAHAARLEQQIAAARVEQADLAGQPKARQVVDMLADWDRLTAAAPAELGIVLRALIRRVVIWPRGTESRVQVIPRWVDGD